MTLASKVSTRQDKILFILNSILWFHDTFCWQKPCLKCLSLYWWNTFFEQNHPLTFNMARLAIRVVTKCGCYWLTDEVLGETICESYCALSFLERFRENEKWTMQWLVYILFGDLKHFERIIIAEIYITDFIKRINRWVEFIEEFILLHVKTGDWKKSITFGVRVLF